MRITVLGSGSGGNATLVEAGGTTLLVDAGLPPRILQRRLEQACGEDSIPRIDAIVLTHAHRDHGAFAGACGAAFGAPVYVTDSTRRTLPLNGAPSVRVYGPRATFAIGAIQIEPETIPHDAPQVALVFAHGATRTAIVTDVGAPTGRLADHLVGCQTVLLESNYEPDMLASGPYPFFLKKRVSSGVGHLSNHQAAELLRALGPETHTIVLLHLSETNNRPDLARDVASDGLPRADVRLEIASQREVLRLDVGVAARAATIARLKRRQLALPF